MKLSGAIVALLTPDAEGWKVHLDGEPASGAMSLPEAAASIPADATIQLALPGHLVLLERLTFPSIDPVELEGMVQLQLEKTIPYPIEEASNSFEIIRQSETESTLLSVAANCAQLEELCAPLRAIGRLPHRITFYAMHVAGTCPPNEVVLAIWPEQGRLEVAIAENGKLGFAHTISEIDPDIFGKILPQVLLSAEMEGVSTQFGRIRLDEGCADLQGMLGNLFTQPIELTAFQTAGTDAPGNLAPSAWKSEALKLENAGRLRQHLQTAAVVYLILLAGAFLYLAWVKSKVSKLDIALAQSQPLVEFVQSSQAQWDAVAPAVDPALSTIEVLFLVYSCRPVPELKITTFEHSPGQFRVQGEAPSANLAIEFLEKLRAEKGLADFTLKSEPPTILPSGATFDIFGKL